MKNIRNYITISLLLFNFPPAQAQSHCLKFSKEGHKDFILSEGKNISFVLDNTGNWNKGKIVKITPDSLFIEENRSSSDLLTERENNFDVNSYHIDDFSRIAFRKTSKIVEGSALLVVYVAALAFSSGALVPIEGNGEKPSKKMFKKNINFNDDWKVEVIQCMIN